MDINPSPSNQDPKAAKARCRADLIMDVLAQRKTATDAAAELGVSRKTFHEWMNRAMEAMAEALTDRDPGRPTEPRPSPKQLELEKQVRELRKEVELLKRTERLRELFAPLRQPLPEPNLVRVTATKKKP